MTFSESIKKAITLAEAVRAFQDVELPKRHPQYPFVDPWDRADSPPPEQEELRDLLESLPEDFIYKLALIMYLGRGDFGTEELTDQYESLKKSFAKPELAISQMLEKAPLADYLSDGLQELAKSGLDIDHLTLVPTGAAGS